MVAPNELIKKEFARSVRGYSTNEVDEYIAYVLRNYNELYARAADIEQKLIQANALNEELSRGSRIADTAIADAILHGEGPVSELIALLK